MTGYRKLSPRRRIDEIHNHNDVRCEPGVYILYKTIDGPPRYVGRSDSNIIERLEKHDDYVYYQYKNCSIEDAYYWECRYWHKYQDDLDNSIKNGGIHPDEPDGIDIPCHVCGE